MDHMILTLVPFQEPTDVTRKPLMCKNPNSPMPFFNWQQFLSYCLQFFEKAAQNSIRLLDNSRF